MNWKIFLFAAIVVLLYVPLTIVGTNTFFPDYSNYDSGCFTKYPTPAMTPDGKGGVNDTVYQQAIDAQQACDKAYQNAKNEYDAQKYIAITILNVLVLLLVIFVAFNDSIRYGLFVGSAVSSFISILTYQQTRSKIGFLVMVVSFILAIWFISREIGLYINKEKPKGKP